MLRKKQRDTQGEARRACSRYWGPEGGAANDFESLAGELRELGLKKPDLQKLRDWLPINATGTTGDKIRNIDSLLGRMEQGA